MGEAVGFAAGLTAGMFAAHRRVRAALGRRARLGGACCSGAGAVGRILTLALAVVNLLVLPFGTALGVYASGCC